MDFPKEMITTFKTGQQSIIDVFDATQPLVRSYLAAKPKIREMKERLLVYLSKQDEELFGRLRSFYQSNREATKMIEFLVHDLKDTKIKYLIFFEKHSGEMSDTNSRDFPKDFAQFVTDILARFKIEEDYLLPFIKQLSLDLPEE